MKNPDIFKVVYAGSIRKVNNLGLLLDVAKNVTNPRVRFLIWGDGDELSYLKQRRITESISNVIFKGRVDKKYIPYITSMADLNIAHNGQSRMFSYGISFNKIFDYLAAGKPILCDFDSKYNPVIQENAGVEVKSAESSTVAETVDAISLLDNATLFEYAQCASKGAKKYDFKSLSNQLLSIIEDIGGK